MIDWPGADTPASVTPMSVWPEAWVVAADRRGLWLVDGEQPWTTDRPVPAGGDVDQDVDRLLIEHGAMPNTVAIHQHTTRVDDRGLAVVHLVVLRAVVLVDAEWPDAVLVSLDMDPELLAALRYVGYLIASDPEFAGLLAGAGVLPLWRGHLRGLVPFLAREPLAV